MTQSVLTRLAHNGRYPFCQRCGCEIATGMLVHRRQVDSGGSKTVNYFCDECERTGRMYAVGKGKED